MGQWLSHKLEVLLLQSGVSLQYGGSLQYPWSEAQDLGISSADGDGASNTSFSPRTGIIDMKA